MKNENRIQEHIDNVKLKRDNSIIYRERNSIKRELFFFRIKISTLATFISIVSILAPLSLLLLPQSEATPTITILMIIVLTAAATDTLIRNRDKTRKMLFINELAQLLSICFSSILFFAAIYKYYGLNIGGASLSHDTFDAIYFSLITFSTVGYGDISPSEACRFYAGFEGLYGNVFMAVIMGFVFHHLSISVKPTDTMTDTLKQKRKAKLDI